MSDFMQPPELVPSGISLAEERRLRQGAERWGAIRRAKEHGLIISIGDGMGAPVDILFINPSLGDYLTNAYSGKTIDEAIDARIAGRPSRWKFPHGNWEYPK